MTLTTFDQTYTDYQLNRGSLRKFIRRAYLRNVSKHCGGPVIDFGCGVGELLTRLPQGSIGLEINPATVEHCARLGLNVKLYDPSKDRYHLEEFPQNKFETLVISHVLEHLDNPERVLSTLLESSERLGLRQLIAIVPGIKGYASDNTHRTFIDPAFIRKHGLQQLGSWSLEHEEFFPFNTPLVGKVFTHNEYMMIFRRSRKGPE
jgi:SAM-dependent methyltransferase